MMNSDAKIYYDNQAKARHVMTSSDVEELAAQMSVCWRRIFADKLPANKSAKIYEAGCGPGAFLIFLKSLGYTNIEASDFSEAQVNIARTIGFNARLADSVADLESIDEKSLDCVVAIDFIEHLEKDNAMRFLKACGRAIKNGGILILRMPNGDSPLVGRNFFNDPTHIWAYTTVSMRALLEIAGFSEIEFRDEAEAMIREWRFLKVPFMRIARWIAKAIIRAATREQIDFLSPSIFVFAKK